MRVFPGEDGTTFRASFPIRERAMLIGTGVRRAMRRAAGWERQKVGLAAHLPRSAHHRFGRLVGNSLRSEARRFVRAARLGQLFETLGRRGTGYFVIRWFNTLPAAPSGDVDFLVADSALATFDEQIGDHFLSLAYDCVYRNDCGCAGVGPKFGCYLRGPNLGTGR